MWNTTPFSCEYFISRELWVCFFFLFYEKVFLDETEIFILRKFDWTY